VLATGAADSAATESEAAGRTMAEYSAATEAEAAGETMAERESVSEGSAATERVCFRGLCCHRGRGCCYRGPLQRPLLPPRERLLLEQRKSIMLADASFIPVCPVRLPYN